MTESARDKAARILADAVERLLKSRNDRAIRPAGFELVGIEEIDELAEALDEYTGLKKLESDDG